MENLKIWIMGLTIIAVMVSFSLLIAYFICVLFG